MNNDDTRYNIKYEYSELLDLHMATIMIHGIFKCMLTAEEEESLRTLVERVLEVLDEGEWEGE